MGMMTRAANLGLLAWMLAAGAAAADTIKLLPGPFELPVEFAGVRYQGEPTRFPDPRLGAGYIYDSDHLLFMVYVFDNGIDAIADGADTIVACEAFEQGKSEVADGGKVYTETRLLYEQLVRFGSPEDGMLAREAKYEVRVRDETTHTFLFVTAAAGKVLKLRLLARPGHDEELLALRRGALERLGTAIKPHLTARKPEADEDAKAEIVFHEDSGNDAQGAINYTFALSVVADKVPEHAPVCGGVLVPTFGEELATYQVMLDVFGELNDKSPFGRKLRDIAAAGFLEEYTWTYAHRDAWGTEPPADLALADFDKWRARKLKRFKPPVLGSVRYPRPRALLVDAQPL